MSFALSAFRSELTHQVLVGITNDVIAFGLISREIKFWTLEDRNKIGQLINHFFSASQLLLIVKMSNINNTLQVSILVSKAGYDFIHTFADVFLSLQSNKVIKGAARPLLRIGIFIVCFIKDLNVFIGSFILELIGNVLHK